MGRRVPWPIRGKSSVSPEQDRPGFSLILFGSCFQKLLAGKGRRLLICGSSHQVSRILAVTGLNQVGLVYATSEEALAKGFERAAETPEGVGEVDAGGVPDASVGA